MAGEALQIAVKRREAKSKGEKERYKHLNAHKKMLNLNHNKKKGNLNHPDRFFSPIRLTKTKVWWHIL